VTPPPDRDVVDEVLAREGITVGPEVRDRLVRQRAELQRYASAVATGADAAAPVALDERADPSALDGAAGQRLDP
jgi:hypothetical protein